MKRTSRIWGFALFSAALFVLCGCGQPTATVTGKVTNSGKLVKGGSVTFVSTEGHASVTGTINEDGTYTLERVPAGAAKICVDTESLNPAKRSKAKSYGPPAGQKAPEGFDSVDKNASKRYVKISPKYASTETTDLTVTVTSGSMTHDIELY